MTIQLERSSRHDDLMTLINGRAPGYSLEAPSTSQDFDLDMSAISRSTGCSWPPRRSCPSPVTSSPWRSARAR